VIRPARADDAEALAALQVRAWRSAYGSYVDAAQIDAAAAGRADRWRTNVGNGDGRGRTHVSVGGDGAPTGFVSVGPSRDDDARPGDGELYALYVEPALLGGGLGSALLRFGEAELARDFAAATLWVFVRNERARRFYERHGWALDDAPFDPHRWAWSESVRLRRELA